MQLFRKNILTYNSLRYFNIFETNKKFKGIITDLSLVQNIESMTDFENLLHSEQLSTLVVYSQGDKIHTNLLDELNSIRHGTNNNYKLENPKFNIFKMLSEKNANLAMGLGQTQSPTLYLVNKGNITSKQMGWPDFDDLTKKIDMLNQIKFDDKKIQEKLKLADELIQNNHIEESLLLLQEILQNHSSVSKINFNIRLIILKAQTRLKQTDKSLEYLTEIYQDYKDDDESMNNYEFSKLKALIEINQMVDEQEGEYKTRSSGDLMVLLASIEDDGIKSELMGRACLLQAQEGNKEMAFQMAYSLAKVIPGKESYGIEMCHKLFELFGKNSEWCLAKKKMIES